MAGLANKAMLFSKDFQNEYALFIINFEEKKFKEQD